MMSLTDYKPSIQMLLTLGAFFVGRSSMAVLMSLIVKGGSSSMGWERVSKKIHVLFGGIVLLKVASSCENSLINISSHPYAYPYAHLSYPYSYLTINKYRLFIWLFF